MEILSCNTDSSGFRFFSMWTWKLEISISKFLLFDGSVKMKTLLDPWKLEEIDCYFLSVYACSRQFANAHSLRWYGRRLNDFLNTYYFCCRRGWVQSTEDRGASVSAAASGQHLVQPCTRRTGQASFHPFHMHHSLWGGGGVHLLVLLVVSGTYGLARLLSLWQKGIDPYTIYGHASYVRHSSTRVAAMSEVGCWRFHVDMGSLFTFDFRYHYCLKALTEGNEEAQQCVLQTLYEHWKTHPQVFHAFYIFWELEIF